jgi:hypothetical protein
VFSAAAHHVSTGTVIGLNRYTVSGMRMSGRDPNSSRSIRYTASPANPCRTSTLAVTRVQSYASIRVSTHASAKPPGMNWPTWTRIR